MTLIVLLIYLAVIFFIAWFFSRKQSLEDYFLNKRKTSLWLLTFSNVATFIGAGAMIAVVAEVYNSGISYGLVLPVSFITGMVILGLVAKSIKAIGDKYDAHTIVDFFHKRFDARNKTLTGLLQLFLLVIWIGVQAIAIASLASVLVGIDYHIALIFSAIVTIAYTAIGGLKIDIITDFVQFWIIFIMFIIMAIVGYIQVGGVGNLLAHLPQGHLDPFAFGGVSWFIGGILLAGFIYLGNTSHWQRILSAKSQKTAKRSFFLTLPFGVLFGVIFLFLGLVASVLLPEIKKETAIFSLMNTILPQALVGLGFASVLAIIMSSIDSLLIGGSTIVYRAVFKKHILSGKKKLFYARLITVFFGTLGFIFAFVIPNIITLSLITAYLALIFIPPIFAGMYSKKISANASFYSILIPTIVLFLLFPIVKENTFVITTPLGIVMILFYDKVFKKRKLLVRG